MDIKKKYIYIFMNIPNIDKQTGLVLLHVSSVSESFLVKFWEVNMTYVINKNWSCVCVIGACTGGGVLRSNIFIG